MINFKKICQNFSRKILVRGLKQRASIIILGNFAALQLKYTRFKTSVKTLEGSLKTDFFEIVHRVYIIVEKLRC